MKILASDFDGTLYFKDHGIKESDIKKIKEFQNKGNLFGMSTGRELRGIVNITDEYGIKLDFLVLTSGSKIMDGNQNIIMNKPLDKKIIKKIYESTQYNQEYMIFSSTHNYLINPKKNRGLIINHPDELDDSDYSSLAIHFDIGEEKEAQKATDYINSHFKDDVIAFRNTINVDIVCKGCSKGLGVLEIAKYFNIDKNNINVIGDSMNDIPMFDITDHAYSFKNIESNLKKHVNYFVDSVAECIDHILEEE